MRSRFTPEVKWCRSPAIALAALVWAAASAASAAVAPVHRHAEMAPPAPELFAKTSSPQQVDLDWYLPDVGIAPPVILQRIDDGPEIEAGELQPDGDGHAIYTANATRQGQRLIHRVRWTARDGVARFSAADTTVLDVPMALAVGAQFGASRVVTHWSIRPVDTRFVVALERSDDGREFEPVTIYRTSRGESFTYADASVQPGHSYRYRLCWGVGTSAEVSGFTAQAPLHGLARGRPDRLTVSWQTSAMAAASLGQAQRGFYGILQRRMPGAAWANLAYVYSQPLAAFVGVDSVGFDDFTAVPGQVYEYRLAWADAGDTLHCAAIAGTLPRMTASLLAVEPQAFGVNIRWQVTPDDPYFSMRVIRRESTSSVWDTLGTSYSELPGLRMYVDNDRSPGHEYVYRLVWAQSGIVGSTASPSVTAVGRGVRLGPARPNPAPEGFSAIFTLPDATPSHLSVLDVSGRVRLVRSYVGPGAFTFALDQGALEAGVYFLRLENGQHRDVQRVVIGR